MTTTAPGRHRAGTPGAGPSTGPRPSRPDGWAQTTIDDLGTPLSEVTFVVVDLETTGGSPADCGITEVGAVKVRGGEVVGELATLVNPGHSIPPFIAALTGITDSMVASAPRIEQVLPAFLEFSRGTVLVAHNAGFDISFLKAATARCGLAWPGNQVLDTVRLARYALARDEVRNHKLSTLARHLGASVTPTHRAFDDARATVDVLHALLGRLGNHGITSLEDLGTFTARVSLAQRRKRHLAEAVPHAPGVYVFNGPGGEVLYVGTSRDLRKRVRSYFTASETRTRMAEMVQLATSVTPIVCATTLEAQVRELRLIAQHKPPYNRRSRHPERAPWVKLTVEPFPRLSIVRTVRDDVHAGATYLGPFSSTAAAEQAVAALHEAFPLRQCTPRLPATPSASARACVLAEIGRCGAPCTGEQARDDYVRLVQQVSATMKRDAAPLADTLLARIRALSDQQRFEDAATVRDRLTAFVRGAHRTQRLAPLAATPELVAARRHPEEGGWEIVLVRHGRLAGTTRSPRGADPMPYVEALRQQGEVVLPVPGPAPAAHPEETEKVLRWLEQPGVRLVHLEGEWSCPTGGAGSVRIRLDDDPTSREGVPDFERPLALAAR
jgi:DNA polymerase-3 subunit epsilon